MTHSLCAGRCAPGACAVLLLAAVVAHAQAAGATAAAPDPGDPSAAVPPVVHRSALTHYRAATADTPADWRQANEAVNRIGGWRAYAREAAQPDPATSAGSGSAPAVAPNPGGHGSHGTK